MKNLVLSLILLAFTGLSATSQERQVNRIPTVGKDTNQEVYTDYDRGFWCAAEAIGGISCHTKGHNMGFAEIDFTAGYRYNEFLKFGIGLGGRYYIDQSYLRRSSIKWGMPIFLAVRGNMMPGTYRSVVPYYGFEIGGSIRDGFMVRPTVGMRIGLPRRAFTLGVSYMGQNIACYNDFGKKDGKFTSFVALRLGYEF